MFLYYDQYESVIVLKIRKNKNTEKNRYLVNIAILAKNQIRLNYL